MEVATAKPSGAGDPDASRAAAILRAAPEVFRIENLGRVAAATVYEFVRRHELYKAAGYPSMKAYAASELAVTEASCKDYARAGNAIWQYFPGIAEAVIEYVESGVHVHPSGVVARAIPDIPSVSVLRELPRVLRGATDDEVTSIVSQVSTGKLTHRELRALLHARPTSRGEPGTEGASQRPSEKRLAVFDDVPEMHEIIRLLGEAAKLSAQLIAGWKEGPGADVSVLVPTYKSARDSVERVRVQLEAALPHRICSGCKGGRCGVCRGTGWLSKDVTPPEMVGKRARPQTKRTHDTVRRPAAVSGKRPARPVQKIGKVSTRRAKGTGHKPVAAMTGRK